MSERIILSIDLAKINKDRIENRVYVNSDGESVSQKNYKMDLVPLKLEKTLKEGPGWKLVKTHFIATAATKEEKAERVNTPIIGDGVVFRTTEKKNDDDLKNF